MLRLQSARRGRVPGERKLPQAARAGKVAALEVRWPTSGTTQVFRDIPADRIIEVTEFAEGYRELIRLEVLLGEIRGEPAARLH